MDTSGRPRAFSELDGFDVDDDVVIELGARRGRGGQRRAIAVAAAAAGGAVALFLAGAAYARANAAPAPGGTIDENCLVPHGGPEWPVLSACVSTLMEYSGYSESSQSGGGAYADAVETVGTDLSTWGTAPAADCASIVVFDIDETVLSNLEVMVELDFGYEKDTWSEWVEEAAAPALQPIADAYAALWHRGYTVAFVTGRHSVHRNATERNLQTAGLGDACAADAPRCGSGSAAQQGEAPAQPCYAKLVLRETADEPDEEYASTYKTRARAALAAEFSATVAATVGDQFSDLTGTDASVKAFKMPNPFYVVL